MQLYSIRFYNQLYLINFFLSIVVQCCTVCICMKAAFGELIPCNYGKSAAFGHLECQPLHLDQDLNNLEFHFSVNCPFN